MKVVGQSDEETADDKVDKSAGESRRHPSAAGHQITNDQHGQTAIQIRLSEVKKIERKKRADDKGRLYQEAKEETSDDGSDEKHGLGEIWPPVVVANPVALQIQQIQKDGQSISIKPADCLSNGLVNEEGRTSETMVGYIPSLMS